MSTAGKIKAQAPVIAVAIQKGGAGKTTTAAALAQAAHHEGKKVLVVDFDPQGNLTWILNGDAARRGAANLLNGAPIKSTIQETPQGLYLIPSAEDIGAEVSTAGSANRLKKALAPVRNSFDLIIIDAPAKTGELLYNALQAATGLIIPVQNDGLMLQGFYQIYDTATEIKKYNSDLKICGVLFTDNSLQTNYAKEYHAAIIEESAAAGVPVLGEIRHGVAIKEAQGGRLDLFEYAPNSKPAADYMTVYKKIIDN